MLIGATTVLLSFGRREYTEWQRPRTIRKVVFEFIRVSLWQPTITAILI